MNKKHIHANPKTKEILISDRLSVEGMEKIGTVDNMPENPKLVVHLMLVRREMELPVSGWTISYDEVEENE